MAKMPAPESSRFATGDEQERSSRQSPKAYPDWVFLLAGVLLAACAGVSLWALAPQIKPEEEGEDDTPRQIVKLTASEYCREYNTNPKATKRKYAGKLIEVRGVVESADSVNVAEQPQLVLKGTPRKGEIDAIVQCMFPVRDEGVVNELVEGQTVTVRGRIKSDTVGFGAPLLDCKLIEASPNPAIRTTAIDLTKEYAADKDATKQRYEKKPMILDGTVVTAKENDFDFEFVLAGFDETAAEPVRVTVEIGHVGMSHTKKQLAAVQPGQVVRIKGEAGFPELDYPITLYKAILLK